MWKDFFYFTKTERQGIIVLVVLIIGVFSIPRLVQLFSTPQEVTPEEDEKFKLEYDEFISSIKEIKPQRKFAEGDPPKNDSYSPKEVRLSIFDPNTADSITFISLGLPPWIAKNILRYRKKQGKFRHPEDFRKIYGLTDEQYQTLHPYIRITEQSSTKDTVRLLMKQGMPQDTLFKYQPGTVINLNEADTTELKKIPGIGSAIARMI